MTTKKKPYIGGATPEQIDQEFEAFWQAYPKEGKANASKKKAGESYHKARRLVSNDTMFEGLDAMGRQWRNKGDAFVSNPPHPTTWLNQARWESEYPIPEQARTAQCSGQRRAQVPGSLNDY